MNREKEIDRLEKRYNSDSAEFVILYGRRRLGKSELAHESIKHRDNAVYYQAIESTAQNQLEQFIDIASETYPSIEGTRQDWEYIIGALGEQNAIIIIDEFPFLIESDSSIPKEHELDVLGLSQDGLVAGECKFTSSPVSEGVLTQLERTTRQVRWNGSESEPYFVLFSRSGFTRDLNRLAEERGDVSLFDVADVVNALGRSGS